MYEKWILSDRWKREVRRSRRQKKVEVGFQGLARSESANSRASLSKLGGLFPAVNVLFTTESVLFYIK